MRLTNDAGALIDADFVLGQPDADGRVTIVLESAGRATSEGGRRNPEYLQLLTQLLRRAAALNAVLEDATVASSRLADLPAESRRIHPQDRPYPIRLDEREDFADLALRLTRPQADIGSTRKATGGGNRRKRMSMQFRLKSPLSRDELEAALAVTAPEESTANVTNTTNITQSAPSREGGSPSTRAARLPSMSVGVTAAHVGDALARWRTDPDAFLAEFPPHPARRFRVVDADAELDAVALLSGARALAGFEGRGPWRIDRASIASPLRLLGYAVEDARRPHEAPLGDDPARYVGLAARLGGTDRAVKKMGRREQGFLRGALGIGSSDPAHTSTCGICGRTFPQSLLVAAHIKPRHICTHAERLDMPWIGWSLCLLGCDALFEQGLLGVDADGLVRPLMAAAKLPDGLPNEVFNDVLAVVDGLVGRRAAGWRSERRGYFAAHVAHHLERRGP